MKIEFHKSMFGFSQDCTLEVTNKSDGVHIEIIKAKYPSSIKGEKVVSRLVNDHKSEHDISCLSMRDCKESANKGFLAFEIAHLEERLARAKFAQKLAKRNKIFVFDRTAT